MITPNYQELKQLAKDYRFIPICKEIYADVVTPISILRRISNCSTKCFLLESVEGGEKWGRYSFMSFDPAIHIICKNNQIWVDNELVERVDEITPFEYLRDVLSEYKVPKLPGMPPFTGGLVGYFSYEMISYFEPSLKLASSDAKDFDLMLFDKVIAFDHLKEKIYIVVNMPTKDIDSGYDKALSDIEMIAGLINDQTPLTRIKTNTIPKFKCNISKEEFCQMVDRTKDYITNGHIFQAVISRRFEAEYEDSLINAYRVLRTTNPSPYMVYLQTDDIQLISTSPETLVKLQDKRVLTYPIAGSRPRGKDKQEDEANEKDLVNDEKELSEHNMLVDLARNDIGRISKYGGVHVTEYKKVNRYSRIMHMASEVEGLIREDKDAFDAIESVFPAGTLSGAPKLRACEIIQKIEKQARGVYGGAIGYIDFSGNMDTCIAIRMAVKQNGKVCVQTGAGIVADSVAEVEYEETEIKARAVIEAIQRASEVDD